MRLPLLIVCAAFVAACSAPNPTPQQPVDAGQPRLCVGGVILDDGTCVAKCDPSKCLPGNTCVDNKCVLTCSAHSQCAKYVQSCLPAVEDDTGADIFVCTNTPVVEYGDPCPNGNECGVCRWNGPGDARAYCTLECRADTDCPGGYECGFVRDPHALCGTTKGNSNHCGQTSEACIEPSSLEPDGGGVYVEGEFCLQRRMCLKKEECAPCQNDVDCSWGFNLACRPLLDGSRCLSKCSQETDCESDKTCFDGHCTPKSGACSGNAFCSPCRYDTECPANHACVQLHGNEKACLDLTFPVACTTDADCPLSPGGKHGACLDGRHGVSSNSSVYRRCYAPHNGDFFTCY